MILQKIKQFLKWSVDAWEDYCKAEHDRYNNGYYDRSDKIKMNCCYCKTDWEIKSYGVSYRCVYPGFVSEPVMFVTADKKLVKEYTNHTERLLSNIHNMDIHDAVYSEVPEPKGIDSLFHSVLCHPPIMAQEQCDELYNYLGENQKREKVIDKIMKDLEDVKEYLCDDCSYLFSSNNLNSCPRCDSKSCSGIFKDKEGNYRLKGEIHDVSITHYFNMEDLDEKTKKN